jgi:hypothetical protein
LSLGGTIDKLNTMDKMACTADITAEVVSDTIVLDTARKNLQLGFVPLPSRHHHSASATITT